MFSHLLTSLRPKQWIKNLLIFAPLIFSHSFTDPVAVNLALTAFGIFCLVTSGVYLLNDIFDRESDRRHPHKRYRPIASGKLPANIAAFVAVILLSGAIG
ncbi:MAG: UbiA family prenyltransferase, partial [Patescibacteria group bacterium]